MAEEESARPILAAILVVVAAFCFSTMVLFAKLAQEHTPTTTFSLVAVRSFIGLVLNAAGVLARTLCSTSSSTSRVSCGCPTTLRDWTWLSVRCIGGCLTVILEFMALKVLPLAIATMIVYSSPAFIVMWSALILQLPVKGSVLSCLALAMMGLLLIVQPWNHHDADAPMWGYVAALVASVSAALAYVGLNQLKNVDFRTVLNAFQGVCLLFAVLVGVSFREFPIPPWSSPAWGYLIAVGVMAYAAEVCITIGMGLAGKHVGEVSVLKLSNPLFSMLWGCLFVGETFGTAELAGCVLIIGASGAVLFLQSRATHHPKREIGEQVDPPEMSETSSKEAHECTEQPKGSTVAEELSIDV